MQGKQFQNSARGANIQEPGQIVIFHTLILTLNLWSPCFALHHSYMLKACENCKFLLEKQLFWVTKPVTLIDFWDNNNEKKSV